MSAAEVEEFTEETLEKNALGIEYTAGCAIGERLKLVREENNLSKETLAKKAKIRERYIDAIELGDWDILPPGLNGRGLVRLYAKELGVQLPEFEGFSNLQTIQAEKQSENLSHTNHSKKSRYQPAAEESAEIIKIVPRAEYKNPKDNMGNVYNHSRESTSSHNIHNKHYQTQTHHTASIVTPKMSDVLGLELQGFEKSAKSTATGGNLQVNSKPPKNNNLNLLPLAKPIHNSKLIVAKNENSLPSVRSIAPPKEAAQVQTKEQPSTEFSSNFKIKFTKPILYSAGTLIILIALFSVFQMNKHSRHKLSTQPLLQSERQLDNSLDKKSIAEKNAPSIKKEVAGVEQKLLATPAVLTPPTTLTERTAKVDILARVKLQVEADGKEIFSGYHQPGSLEFNFKDKTEILVYDASKVKLTYGSWDHGELGWNERKRKITLNAKPYED